MGRRKVSLLSRSCLAFPLVGVFLVAKMGLHYFRVCTLTLASWFFVLCYLVWWLLYNTWSWSWCVTCKLLPVGFPVFFSFRSNIIPIVEERSEANCGCGRWLRRFDDCQQARMGL